jgi:predicted transcriptional regulator
MKCVSSEISREQAAREAGIDPSTLHYICSAEKDHKPKPETIRKLVDALRKHKEWLDTYKIGLFNAAIIATDEQVEDVRHQLTFMKYIDEHPLQQE